MSGALRKVGVSLVFVLATTAVVGAEGAGFRVRVEPGHPWRPPFGLERVGSAGSAVVEADADPAGGTYQLVANRAGHEVHRQGVSFPSAAPFVAKVPVQGSPDELVLVDVRSPTPLATQSVTLPAFEAEAVARTDEVVNPVDLGAILVPAGWLLLGPGQKGTVEVAALSRGRALPDARLRMGYASAAGGEVVTPLPLAADSRRSQAFPLPKAPDGGDRDSLRMVVDDGHGAVLWEKAIPTMLVAHPPTWPKFGATATKLRFDPPISVRDPQTGAFSSIPYEEGFDPKLRDVVVSFPNGARYVFWRGSSFIPFWAGRHNTGACYEWAEIITRLPGAVDCVEPLMDKSLRYGKVAIVESTPARVHVRWTYQSTDLNYQTWGDSVVEDYTFTPDGYGTRVVRLRSGPATEYELNEFIVLTPQDAYPLDVLPENLVDAVFLDGRVHHFAMPHVGGTEPDPKGVPAIYRLKLGKPKDLAAVCFNPGLTAIPGVIFGPFSDAGQMVTPCYWGSHWPVARGNATGSKIDDRIHLTPTHNSVMSWAATRPTPLRSAEFPAVDLKGQSRVMADRTWAWLIGMSDEGDERLVERARGFSTPPSLEAVGATPEPGGYVPERRALRLRVEAPDVTLTVKPAVACVNPSFELDGAAAGPLAVMLDGNRLDASRFAWDGRVLWLDATLAKPTELRLHFAGPGTGN